MGRSSSSESSSLDELDDFFLIEYVENKKKKVVHLSHIKNLEKQPKFKTKIYNVVFGIEKEGKKKQFKQALLLSGPGSYKAMKEEMKRKEVSTTSGESRPRRETRLPLKNLETADECDEEVLEEASTTKQPAKKQLAKKQPAKKADSAKRNLQSELLSAIAKAKEATEISSDGCKPSHGGHGSNKTCDKRKLNSERDTASSTKAKKSKNDAKGEHLKNNEKAEECVKEPAKKKADSKKIYQSLLFSPIPEAKEATDASDGYETSFEGPGSTQVNYDRQTQKSKQDTAAKTKGKMKSSENDAKDTQEEPVKDKTFQNNEWSLGGLFTGLDTQLPTTDVGKKHKTVNNQEPLKTYGNRQKGNKGHTAATDDFLLCSPTRVTGNFPEDLDHIYHTNEHNRSDDEAKITLNPMQCNCSCREEMRQMEKRINKRLDSIVQVLTSDPRKVVPKTKDDEPEVLQMVKEKHIYIGRGFVMSRDRYQNVLMYSNKTNTKFVSELTKAVFGFELLAKSRLAPERGEGKVENESAYLKLDEDLVDCIYLCQEQFSKNMNTNSLILKDVRRRISNLCQAAKPDKKRDWNSIGFKTLEDIAPRNNKNESDDDTDTGDE